MESHRSESSSLAASHNNATSSDLSFDGVKAVDVQHLLRDRVAMLTGGTDRQGRPIITFPSRESADKTTQDDLNMLLRYLYTIPSDDVKERGFTVIMDMRRGMTWAAAKPILKVLQEHFAGVVHSVHVIKPDTFWEKHKASFNSSKYKFVVQVIGVDQLPKYIDPKQLTGDFDGSLAYDHDEWLELRVAVEDIISRSVDVLREFDVVRKRMEHGQLPVDVASAQTALAEHKAAYNALNRAPVTDIDAHAQTLLSGLRESESTTPGHGHGPNANTLGTGSTVQHITQLLHTMRHTQQHLFTVWRTRKHKLDQCFQLKLFQQDADTMIAWIRDRVHLFLASYAHIGDSTQSAQAAQHEHQEFTRATMTTEVNITHIGIVAQKLLDSSPKHYACADIKTMTKQLHDHWTMLTQALQLRTQLLMLSVNLHARADQYVSNYDRWLSECTADESQTVSNAEQLMQAINKHQQLTDSVAQAYSDVMGTAKALIDSLKCAPVASAESAQHNEHQQQAERSTEHIKSVLHALMQRNSHLGEYAKDKRIVLHQRLALLHFEQDVRSVIDWLDKHGQVFLRKNTGMGKTLQRARQLQKSQQHFEKVAENTYVNAEKLIGAAEDLAGSGECDGEQVFALATQLRSRIQAFEQQVSARRELLKLSMLFHTHCKEMLAWYEELQRDDICRQPIADSTAECEHRQEQWISRTDETMRANVTCGSEGQQLIAHLRQQQQLEHCDNTECVQLVEHMLAQIESTHNQVQLCWQQQRQLIHLAGRFRRLQDDVHTIMTQLQGWREDMHQMTHELCPNKAQHVVPMHHENIAHVRSAMHEIIKLAQELIREIEASGLRMVTSDGQDVLDCIVNVMDSAKQLERQVMGVAEQTQSRLEQAQQLGALHTMSTQVLHLLDNAEQQLHTTVCIPDSLVQAEAVQREHKDFQQAVERTNQEAMRMNEAAEEMLACGHYEPDKVRQLADQVVLKWRRLVMLSEERHKLLQAAVAYYKTLEQMVPALKHLEMEYSKPVDVCTTYASSSTAHNQEQSLTTNKIDFITSQMAAHKDKKEKVLRCASYARKMGEMFLRFIRKLNVSPETCAQSEQNILQALEQLRLGENTILQLWSKKKHALDECHSYVLFEASASERLDWLMQHAELYLSSRPTGAAGSRASTQALMQEHEQFKLRAKEQRDKVRLVLGLGQSLLDDVHELAPNSHAQRIHEHMHSLQLRYNDFSQRCDRWDQKLRADLGVADSQEAEKSLSLDRQSDASLDAKIEVAVNDFDKTKRLSSRKKDFVMSELLSTERAYVSDLGVCLQQYMAALNTNSNVPGSVKDQQAALFGNLQQIYDFHKLTFLKELEQYEALPEDVGHCFVTWAETLQKMYVQYCKNKDLNKALLGQTDVERFFTSVQKEQKLSMQLQAYLIKPVQRITKYQLLLKDLCSCCEGLGELDEALQVMLNVPKRANDMIHMNMLSNCPDMDSLGEVLLQDQLTVWDPKLAAFQIRKGRERQVFLFDVCVLMSKKSTEPTASGSRVRYIYKSRLMLSDINVTEHIEGDPTKFALWTGTKPNSEFRTIIKASDQKVKVAWVRKLRELIGQRLFHLPLHDHRVTNGSVGDSASVRSGSHLFMDDTQSNSSAHTNGHSHADRHSILSSVSSEVDQCAQSSSALYEGAAVFVTDTFDTTDGEQLLAGTELIVLQLNTTNTNNTATVCRPLHTEHTFKVPVTVLSLNNTTTDNATERRLSCEPVAGTSGTDNNEMVNKRTSLRRLFGKSDVRRQLSDNPSTASIQESDAAPNTSQECVSARACAPSSSSQSQSQSLNPNNSKGASASNPNSSLCTALVPDEDDNTTDLPADIHIPPPMDSLATDKLTAINGHEDTTVTSGELPSDMQMNQLHIDDSSPSVSAVTGDTETESVTAPVDNGTDESLPPAVELSPEEKARQKRSYVLAEMVETEKDYVRDLGTLVTGYMVAIKEMGDLPDDMIGKDKIVFANIQQIYEWHRDVFQNEIAKCLEDYTFAGKAFVRYVSAPERKLHMYVVYCQNKPKSEYLVAQDNMVQLFSDIKKKLGHRLTIGDLLIKPVQRIMKYQLLLKDILKQTERAKDSTVDLEKALLIMHVVPKECDDMMQVGRLQGFEGNIVAQGKLLMQSNLVVYDNTTGAPTGTVDRKSGKERRLFLFEQSIFIADCIKPKSEYANPNYVYKSHFMINRLAMEEDVADEPLMFLLKRNDAPMSFTIQAESLEQKKEWVDGVSRLLDGQQLFLATLQQPQAALPGAKPQANAFGAPASAAKDKKASSSSSTSKIGKFLKGSSDKKEKDSDGKSSGRTFFGSKK